MKYTYFSFFILIFALFSSCTKKEIAKTEIYNQKANDLIFQTLKENKCNCMLQIPKESMVEISIAENPSYDIRTILKKQLNAKTTEELGSLIDVSKNFKLDLKKIKLNKIKIVTLKDILDIREGKDSKTLEICKSRIICFQKPIFDENYTKAVLEYGYAFTCVRMLPSPTYNLNNGKWIRPKK